MKKLFLFIFFLFMITGCFWKKGDKTELADEIEATGSVLKVNVSPHAPILTSKRIGVLPFTGKNETLGIYLSKAVADNLVLSGLQIIEYDHLISELKKLLEEELKLEEENNLREDRETNELKNEWEQFKELFKKDTIPEDDITVTYNLIKLSKLDLVDYLLTGRVDVKRKWFLFKFFSKKVTEASMDIVNILDGKIIYSVNYVLGEEEDPLTPRELSDKLASALVAAIQ